MLKTLPIFFKRFRREGALLGIILLIIYRAPYLFYEPRFYAEGGALYFAYAFMKPWYVSLVMFHQGYYALFNNVVSLVAAKWFTLELGPHVHTYSSLLVFLVPFALVLWGRSVLFATYSKKLLVCSFILFSTPGIVWLNLVSSQYYFCLTVFLILVQDTETLKGSVKWLFRVILFIAGLTGVLSCFLIPLFYLKYRARKHREHAVHLAILCACACLHLALFFWLLYLGGLSKRLDSTISFYSAVKLYFTYNVFGPVLGQQLPVRYMRLLSDGGMGTIPGVALSTAFILYGACLTGMIWNGFKIFEQRLVILGFFIVSILSTLLSWKSMGGLRYAYVPGVFLLILISTRIQLSWKGKRDLLLNSAAFLMVAVFMVTGITEYKYRLGQDANPGWPRWKDEIAIWKKNPSYRPRIWPRSGINWTMYLVEYKEEEGEDPR